MIYKYFYEIDDIDIAINFQTMISSLLENCKETLWNMGEALWYVDFNAEPVAEDEEYQVPEADA